MNTWTRLQVSTSMSRTRLSTGTFPSSKVGELPLCRPFTQQLDLVFPASDAFENVLQNLNTGYVKTKSALASFVELVRDHINPLTLESDVIAVGYNSLGTDDTWCIDTRGVLTLCVARDTYQRLGLMGSKLPWKHCEGQYIVVLAWGLSPDSSDKSAKSWNVLGPKQKAALELYDRLRLEAGLDLWEVVYHSTRQGVLSPEHELTKVDVQTVEMSDVYIPEPNLSPPAEEGGAKMEDWNEHISDLYEWVGMACLGAQRLYINDRVDPYVAVYTPPLPSHPGTITHARWRGGLLHPSFVQAVLATARNCVTSEGLPGTPPFVAMTVHSVPAAPVGVVPSSASSRLSAPVRLPREDAEDTLSIVLARSNGKDVTEDKISRWCSVECIGPWDTRWG